MTVKQRVHLFVFILLFSSLIQASQQKPSLSCRNLNEDGSIAYQVELFDSNAYLSITDDNAKQSSYSLRPFEIDDQTLSFDLKLKNKDYLVWIDETSDLEEITLIVMSDTKKRQSQEEYHFLSCDS